MANYMKKLLKEQNTDWSVISEKVWQNGDVSPVYN